MKKILIFGCSFSAGSYSVSNIKSKRDICLDELINNRGWWYYVDYFRDKDVTIIACTGQGYWSYYQILLFLKEEGRLINYDEIWIQETSEPRPTINNYRKISHILSPAYVNTCRSLIDNFKLIHLGPTNDYGHLTSPPKDGQGYLSLRPGRTKLERGELAGTWLEPYTLWNSFFMDITNLCAKNIDVICKEHNIKGYVWSMHNSIMSDAHFIKLPLVHIKGLCRKNNLLTSVSLGAHQTEEGTKYIGELINKEIN